jgi:SAM-dependent methyltransferase
MTENPAIYSREYFQRLHDVEERHWWSQGMRDVAEALIESHFGRRDDLDILDAGCGTGITLGWLRRYSRHRPVEGIDVAPEALEFCRARGHEDVREGSVLDLPYADQSFDLVVCHDVIQHLEDDVAGLREMRRVLRPGGALLVRTNTKLAIGKGKPAASGDYRMYTPAELREKVSAAGLEVRQLSHANALMSLPLMAKRYLRERKEATYGDRGLPIRLLPPHLAWLSPALRTLLRAEARYLADFSHSIPFGSAIVFLAERRDLPAGAA